MTIEEQNNLNSKTTQQRKRKKQYAASTANSSNLEDTSNRLKSLRSTNTQCCCCDCNSQCTGKIKGDINTFFCCCVSKKIGEMFVLCERDDGSPLVIAGPDWGMCVCCTVPIILFGGFFISFFVIARDEEIPIWILPVYLSIVVITLVSLFMTGCRDPGLLERCTDEEVVENGWFWNEQVGSFRPSHAAYCKECKVLIEDYDHACPWTGSAIGKGNIMAFRFFLVFSHVLCYSSIAIVLYHVLKDTKE